MIDISTEDWQSIPPSLKTKLWRNSTMQDDIYIKHESDNNITHKPSHYMLLPEYEVKDIIKAWADRVDDSDMPMTSYQAGYVVQALQYLLRCYAKGQWQDVEKAVKVLQFALETVDD
jgi:hypothetical protein